MTLITIRETTFPQATVSFDRRGEYPITIQDPFDDKQEKELEWFFEEYLRWPFVQEHRAAEARKSIQVYGETLFQQVIQSNLKVVQEYGRIIAQGASSLQFEVLGSPAFHRWHWEALKDPDRPLPFVLEAPMVRSTFTPPSMTPAVQTSPTINLLVVTARPRGRQDVGYRTITRPLVEGLRQASLPVQVEIVRPGTYRALLEHLEQARQTHGIGHYHLIHFDLHGALLQYQDWEQAAVNDHLLFRQGRFGRGDITPYDGLKAFLAFEKENGEGSDLAEAAELANLLHQHHIPIAVLNACQSGKQVGSSETSLGSRLLQAGVQTVVAMSYSVTVSAAVLMMKQLYSQLFAHNNLAQAIRLGRAALSHQKERQAIYDQRIELEDWLLPVVYQLGGAGATAGLPLRPFTPEEQTAYWGRQTTHYKTSEPTYGFVGRDVDILHIEKRLLTQSEGKRRNLLLIRGLGGAGKTTLLRHLGAWWQQTGLVRQVFYFGYDERAWVLPQLLDGIAQQLYGGNNTPAYRAFQLLPAAAQAAQLGQTLRAERHLLILDNLESVTGEHLAIRNTLTAEEQAAVRGFLADLLDGQTLVLLGTRGGEGWLTSGKTAPLRPEQDIYHLPGLDEEAAALLAERVLERHVADQEKRKKYHQDEAFRRLLKLLNGYPLPLEVVLANLKQQNPADILAALQAGDVRLDSPDGKDKTESILRCIEYSHSNLSPAGQTLLLCLSPFAGVINTNLLAQYTAQLQQQPALAHLPFEQWGTVLQEAADWGLLGRHELPGYLALQPTLPYFLRGRLQTGDTALRQGIEAAFRQLYDGIGDALRDLMASREAQEKQLGQLLAGVEYENLYTALELALAAQVTMLNPYAALSDYLDTRQDHKRGLVLGQRVLAQLEQYPAAALAGALGVEVVTVLDDIASRYLLLQQYPEAETAYRKTLELHNGLTIFTERDKLLKGAGIYHQLGRVAQEQRRWAEAETAYRQALSIKQEFNDRYSQASTYHQLGSVAQEQRRWAEAETAYRQALSIYQEFNDRYSQAGTYHQLGMVAQEQRRWAEAETAYRQALSIKQEFNDRYSQASTYHQLGSVAQEQRRWAEAREHLLLALHLFTEFQDEHLMQVTLRSLARLWRESGDGQLPAAVGQVLGVAAAEVEKLFQVNSEQ